LYSIAVHPFYVPKAGMVTAAVVFAAFVDEPADITLAAEHDASEWLPPDAARARFIWPRSRTMLDDILSLLATGDAGPAEDVLRVR
jgi:hypothetical protein